MLGAGGVVGHAFHVGVLSALADEFGWDARRARLVVGTSAGSVVGASLRAGLGPDRPAPAARRRAACRPRGPRSSTAPRRPWRRSPSPATGERRRRRRRGRGDGVRRDRPPAADRLAGSCQAGAARAVEGDAGLAGLGGAARREAPDRPPARALRRDDRADRGRTRTCGSSPSTSTSDRASSSAGPAHPRRRVGEAVEASCAIPGYFAPVTIDGARYVDGGRPLDHQRRPRRRLRPAAGPRPRRRADVGDQPRRATGADAVVASARPPSGRRRGRRPARQRARSRSRSSRPPTDLGVMIGDSMDPAKASTVCARSSSRHAPTCAGPRSPNGSPCCAADRAQRPAMQGDDRGLQERWRARRCRRPWRRPRRRRRLAGRSWRGAGRRPSP